MYNVCDAGTVRKGRKGFPASLSGFTKANMLPRGTLVVKMHRSRRITAICWMDKKPVFLLSTACNPIATDDCFAPRWVPGVRERVSFPTSPILLQYQSNMRGVDIVDQEVQEYTVQFRSHKWWHKLFMFVLDSSLVNTYVMYEAHCVELGLPVQSRLMWHYKFAYDLVKSSVMVGRIPNRVRNIRAAGFHHSEGHITHRRMCIVCRKRTRRFCGGCFGAFMCGGGLFCAGTHANGLCCSSCAMIHNLIRLVADIDVAESSSESGGCPFVSEFLTWLYDEVSD